jgi:HAD superfamily hydrolase (TIGR01484 family)
LKGCICLDIDGTITADLFHIPEPVIECFEMLYQKGWKFLFSTGRPYTFASKAFHGFTFPFFLSLQNGADLLQMPEKKLLAKEHLNASFILKLDEIYKDMEEDFLVYAGFEKGDFCYYRPKRYSSKMLEHLEVVKSVVSETWQEVEEFAFGGGDSFPLIKSLGSKEQMEQLSQKLLSFDEVHSTYIRDPLSQGKTYINLITSKRATKGAVIKKVRTFFPEGTRFIAAGDDRNDILMLEEADFAIVMKTAPESMFPLADLIAEPASDFGIIAALLEATGEMA